MMYNKSATIFSYSSSREKKFATCDAESSCYMVMLSTLKHIKYRR